MWKHNIQKEFMETQKLLTLQGYIVISVGLFGHSGDEEVWEGMDENTLTQTKVMLDDMHKRKIDMADEIYVINVGGYISESTKSEIKYAKEQKKRVKYLKHPLIGKNIQINKNEEIRIITNVTKHEGAPDIGAPFCWL